ncbi:hypothetical protein EAG_09231 [Camponotus floridanus]|uniref:Uncharacterized protein n=1 Tax=Camponotus floridanus TaxID=104421 RepID=E2AL09_CAMFO|nr:hypothetical protein EAG_09231 [Camponotus floridanus]
MNRLYNGFHIAIAHVDTYTHADANVYALTARGSISRHTRGLMRHCASYVTYATSGMSTARCGYATKPQGVAVNISPRTTLANGNSSLTELLVRGTRKTGLGDVKRAVESELEGGKSFIESTGCIQSALICKICSFEKLARNSSARAQQRVNFEIQVSRSSSFITDLDVFGARTCEYTGSGPTKLCSTVEISGRMFPASLSPVGRARRPSSESAFIPRILSDKETRPPQPHHLDYLDYRDPRSILRVQDKPSRAVLCGYRPPRALPAKSQGVPLSIDATAQSSASPRLAPGGANSPLLLRNESNLLRDSHLLLATQNALITSQRPPSPPAPPAPTAIRRDEFPPCRDLDVGLVAEGYPADARVPARPRDSGIPITPTHRPRASPARTPSSPTGSTAPTKLAGRETSRRRPSVDSEGYSYIDFKDSDLEAARYARAETANPPGKRLMRSTTARSSSVDSDGYSYIIDYNGRKAPGAARRLVADGTEEEVCPLCTMQQIHHLLSQPEQDVYLRVQDT